MSANAAVIIARLGGKASWCGRLGDDARGRQILEGLHEENVDASAARILPGASSPHSIVLVDSEGRRALVLHRPLFDDAQTDWLPLGEIDRVDAVLADNRWVPGARTLLQAARARGVPAVLDADVGTGAETIEAVRAATHRFFSGAALAYLYGRPDPEEGLRQAARDCRFVSVTLGQEGARWLDAHGAFCTQPAFPAAAVETGGAGDIFHGAFTLALVETGDEVKAMRFAAAAAALKCSRAGGRASFPDRRSVEAFLQAHPTVDERASRGRRGGQR